jgi:hypothetical protein
MTIVNGITVIIMMIFFVFAISTYISLEIKNETTEEIWYTSKSNPEEKYLASRTHTKYEKPRWRLFRIKVSSERFTFEEEEDDNEEVEENEEEKENK